MEESSRPEIRKLSFEREPVLRGGFFNARFKVQICKRKQFPAPVKVTVLGSKYSKTAPRSIVSGIPWQLMLSETMPPVLADGIVRISADELRVILSSYMFPK